MPVAYSVYHMHRRQDLYGPDASSFRPERWEGPELADIKWGYLPFNGGPRLCLGSESFIHSFILQIIDSLHQSRKLTAVDVVCGC